MDKQVTMVMRKNMELVLIREGKLSEIEARAGRHILGSFITWVQSGSVSALVEGFNFFSGFDDKEGLKKVNYLVRNEYLITE